MKIFQYTYAPIIGGVLKHMQVLSQQLQTRSIDVRVFLNQTQAIDPIVHEFVQSGIPVFREVAEGKRDVFRLQKFISILRKEQPEIVHFHLANSFENFLPIMVAGLLGIKIVLTEHCPFYPSEKRKIKYALKRISLHCVRNVLLLGLNVRSQYLALYPGASDKIVIIPPFSRHLPPRHIDHIMTLGFIGEFSENKGIHLLVEWAPRLIEKGFRLVFCGKGGLEPKLHALKERFPESIEIRPFSNDQNSCYENLDVLLLLSGNEGLPLVVLEAVSAGIPVIATDVGVVKEYFSPGTGVLFLRERSPDLILDHLECLQQKEFRERIIHQGTEYFFAHLSPDIVTDRILALYQGC